MSTCPPDILALLNGSGEMAEEQVRRLIAWEASLIGLTIEQAQAAQRDGTLPRTALGSDIDLLLRMIEP